MDEITKEHRAEMLAPIINTLDTYAYIQQIERGEVAKETFDHSFKAKNFGFGNHTSTCRVTIYRNGKWALVILQDLGIGTSVTNASEQLATEIGRLKGLDPNKTVWLECYPYERARGANHGDYDVDRIAYDFDSMTRQYSNPQWAPCRNKVIVDFLKRTLTVEKG